jgi:hypothetical protein
VKFSLSDDDEQVESAAHQVVHQLEAAIGRESLQPFF